MEIKLQHISKHEKITLRLSFLYLHYIVAGFLRCMVSPTFYEKQKNQSCQVLFVGLKHNLCAQSMSEAECHVLIACENSSTPFRPVVVFLSIYFQLDLGNSVLTLGVLCMKVRLFLPMRLQMPDACEDFGVDIISELQLNL